MSNNKDFKVKNGVQAAAYYETEGTVIDGIYSLHLEQAPLVSTYTGFGNVVYGMKFKPDGTKLYYWDTTADELREYTLSTAWDLDTATFTNSLSGVGLGLVETGIEIKPDGTKLYVINVTDDLIEQLTLNTPWDISTATSDLTVASPHLNPYGMQFKPDGTKLYMATTSSIVEYPLSTAWDLTTIGSANYSFTATRLSPSAGGWRISPSGTKLYWYYAYSTTIRYIYAYDIETPWDLSTVKATTNRFETRSVFGPNLYSFEFKQDDESKLYVGRSTSGIGVLDMSATTKTCDLSTGSYFEVNYDGSVKIGLTNPPAAGKVANALVRVTGKPSVSDHTLAFMAAATPAISYGRNAIAFNGDGTSVYTSHGPYKYDLRVPWDLSSIDHSSFTNYAGLITGVGSSSGMVFANDGYSLFLAKSDTLYDHTLTVPYDLSTATLNQTVTGIFTQNYTNLAVGDNNTKIYTSRGSPTTIYEYTLSTAGDPSTATLTNTFSGITVDNVWGIDFNSAGTKMYVNTYSSSTASSDILIYTLSTPWDIGTAVFVGDIRVGFTASNTPYGMYNFVLAPNEEYFYATTYDVTPNLFKILQYRFSEASLFSYDSNIKFNNGVVPTRQISEASRYELFTTSDGGSSYTHKVIFGELYND